MGFETTMLLLTWVAIALLAFVVAGLVRRVHHLGIGVRTDDLGPAAGSTAPEFGRLARGGDGDTLLLFLDADCGVCPEVLAELEATGSAQPVPPVAAIFSGEAPVAGHGSVEVFARESGLFDAYDIPAVPFAVLVDQVGRVRASRPVGSPGTLRELLENMAIPATAMPAMPAMPATRGSDDPHFGGPGVAPQENRRSS